MTVTEAFEARDRALDEVTAARPYTTGAGLKVIEEWAAKGRPFSLNDCRQALHAVGVTGQYAPGAVVRRALQLRIIRKVDSTISTSGPTHGKEIKVYVAGAGIGGLSTLIPTPEQLTVPVVRDNGGRFTTPAPGHAQEELF